MSKQKAIEFINRAKEQLSDELVTIRFVQMANRNLDRALKEWRKSRWMQSKLAM